MKMTNGRAKRIDVRSRRYKITQQLNKAASAYGQHRIPEFFPILNEIQILSRKNRQLEECLQDIRYDLQAHSIYSTAATTIHKNEDNINSLLNLLLTSAKKNSGKNKNGYRHDNTIKMFMCYLKMLGGSFFYETLHANLSTCIPSPSSINNYIADHGPRISEGLLRTDELLEYLKKRNLPLVVVVAEDGTRTVGKVCYDPHSNKLVGFSLPLNNDGMPITNQFMARNASEIEGHFTNEANTVSTVAYVIMAQPLSKNVSPFTLTLFSTNNKFDAMDVSHRWKFIRTELRKKGIDVLNFASDGDPKLLKAMSIETGIGTNSEPNETTDRENDELLAEFSCRWFNCKRFCVDDPLFIQDMIHILTKLRNRILRMSSILPLGNGVVSKSFLRYLMDNVSKDKHCLTLTDINPKDRQNSDSAAKICSINIQNCLRKHVPGSSSTVLYLKMMNLVTSSMLDPNMSVDDRILNMWHGLFILRIWRSWLLKFPKPEKNRKNGKAQESSQPSERPVYSIQENFISNNAYTCIEINAHMLVLLIIKLRTLNRPDLLLTHLIGSQSCELTFRQLRSMTTTNSTVVNFNMLEMINRLKRIHLQSEITCDAPDNIKFPRIQQKRSHSLVVTEFPSNADIEKLIECARVKAISDVLEVGIDVREAENEKVINFYCQVNPAFASSTDSDEDELLDLFDPDDKDLVEDGVEAENVQSMVEPQPDELCRDLNTLKSLSGNLNIKDQKSFGIDLSPESPYCVVSDNTGNEKVVRKSSICWFLSKDKHSLSSDRLSRVKQSDIIGSSQGSRKHAYTTTAGVTAENCLLVNDCVSIGEWCLVEKNGKVLVGLVLGFCYLNGSTQRAREYSSSFASIDSKVANSQANPVGFLCSYFCFDSNGTLDEEPQTSTYIDVKNYRATILSPTFENTLMRMDDVVVKSITIFLDKMKNSSTSTVDNRKKKPELLKNQTEEPVLPRNSTEEPKELDFVIVSVPTRAGLTKLYIGQVCEKGNDHIKINFLKQSKAKFEDNHDTYHFHDTNDSSFVDKSEIIKVLEEPVISRRGKFIFKELKEHNYKIC